MSALRTALAEVNAVPDQRERTNRFKQLVDSQAAGDANSLRGVLDYILGDDVPQVVSRQVAAYLAEKAVQGLKTEGTGEEFKELCQYGIRTMGAQLAQYEDADFLLRDGLFNYLVLGMQFSDAANVLGGLNMETSGRTYSDKEKAEVYVKIAEAYLEDGESDAAETFVNKASAVMREVDDRVLQLRYRTTSAQVLDSNRKFLDAAMRFSELSQTTQADIDAGDLLVLLGKAVTCAILSKAGPQRNRVLGTLMKDERLDDMEQIPELATHAQVLKKMYREQILRQNDLEAFEATLMTHQKATMGDGLTILERAVVEHNMVAAARVYENVRFEELGNLLETPPKKAVKVAARMISEGRLHGTINQVDGLLSFLGANDELQNWDERITSICNKVNACVDAVSSVCGYAD